MKIRIPPHIAWPLYILFLLLIGVGGSFAALIAARSDGGVEIVGNYYQKAITWDETTARRSASDALGWTSEVSVLDHKPDSPFRAVELRVFDREAKPVSRLRGTIRSYRPQEADPVSEIPLNEVPDQPGVYRQDLPLMGAGLWDFEVNATRDTAHFEVKVRREVR